MSLDDYSTVQDAARRLGLKPVSVRRAISAGTLRAHRLGPIHLIENDEIERYRAAHLGRRGRRPQAPRG